MTDNDPDINRRSAELQRLAEAHTVQLSLGELSGAMVGGQLALVIVNDQELATCTLPERSRAVVGRSESADFQIDDPSMSRHHFAIHTGEQILLEDLGSSNGTRVGDRILRRGEAGPLGVGVPVQAGQTTFVLRPLSNSKRPRRIVNHGYFELRVEEESLRAGESSRGYAVLRVKGDGAKVERTERIVADNVGAGDVVGSYGPPGEYEVLLVDVTLDGAERRAQAIESAFGQEGIGVLTGLAVYPRDGGSPDRIIARAGEALRGDDGTNAGTSCGAIYGSAMARIQALADRVALGRISVLVLGETGVGKEVMARQVHLRSRRSEGPLLTLNCASLNEELLASELFGHVKGAFTGAVKDKVGLIEAANGGTLFLDEVGDVAAPIQAKLLRVLEEGKLTRVGEVQPREVDVRFIAATNRDLERAVRDGAFREDLYYRLAGVTIVVPPLRERLDEVLPLTRNFVSEICERDDIQPIPELGAATTEYLLAYNWPGNIRELRNMVERAVLLCGSTSIEPEHLLLDKMGSLTSSGAVGLVPTCAPGPVPGIREGNAGMEEAQSTLRGRGAPALEDENQMPLGRPVDVMRRSGPQAERGQVLAAMTQCNGNQTQAAKLLGISRGTLIKRLAEYGLSRPRRRGVDN